jgi:hypothetical protein
MRSRGLYIPFLNDAENKWENSKVSMVEYAVCGDFMLLRLAGLNVYACTAQKFRARVVGAQKKTKVMS